MSISIGSDSLYVSNVLSEAQNKTDKLKNTLNEIDTSNDEELMSACKSFESYLLEQTFKALEKTVLKDEEEESSGNDYMNYFGDTMFQSIAETSTETEGFGIAQMLYESMKRNGNDKEGL